MEPDEITEEANNQERVSIRSVIASLTCRLGTWLIHHGYRFDPGGGAVAIVVVHGDDHWSRCWYQGWPDQAILAAATARMQAEALEGLAEKLSTTGLTQP